MVQNMVPDGIVLDMVMPDMDGFQVLEKLKSLPNMAGVPVLVLTARDLSVENRQRLKYNNVQELIQKGSLDREQLVDRIRGIFQPKITAPSTGSSPLSKSDALDRTPDRKLILMVEDNPDNRITMEAVLKEGGYECHSVQDGETGIRAAGELRPDLILMDIQLPGLNGLEAARRIKADPDLAATPILALTARAMKGEKEEIINQGLDGYLSKPVNPEELLNALNKWIG
jgi:CheY-like chemotaxis protein